MLDVHSTKYNNIVIVRFKIIAFDLLVIPRPLPSKLYIKDKATLLPKIPFKVPHGIIESLHIYPFKNKMCKQN